MFTGIVEELGEVVALDHQADSARLTVRAPGVTADAVTGASMAVNGVCLTVVDLATGVFTADVMRETLSRSSLGELTVGSRVNLERAVRASDRLGGHIVQGHVDGVGTVIDRRVGDGWETMRISLPEGLSRYVVEKGSISVDGVCVGGIGVSGGHYSEDAAVAEAALATLG